jgi:hypothetical protein
LSKEIQILFCFGPFDKLRDKESISISFDKLREHYIFI